MCVGFFAVKLGIANSHRLWYEWPLNNRLILCIWQNILCNEINKYQAHDRSYKTADYMNHDFPSVELLH